LYPSGTAVVGPGVEFDNVGGSGTTVDFSANNILVNYPSGWTLNGSGTFDGWVFADLSASNIVGVSLDSTNLPGFTASDLSFGPNFVRANTLGLGSWGPGTNISIDVTFGVPEPSTWAMMLLGFAGIGFAGYRSSRKGRAVSLAA
jgi:PEP-CTERM motif